jgi:uncharacterized protein (DUF488 family)
MSNNPEPPAILTVGHSAHSREYFTTLLRNAGVTAVADVRTVPYSRRYPHFGRERLSTALLESGIHYVFLGKKLGGRPDDPTMFRDGAADYEKMAGTDEFAEGLDCVIEQAGQHRLALMCSEHDPLDCHRCLLVARALAERSVAVDHLLRDGSTMPHAEVENRLLGFLRQGAEDLFAPRATQLAAAYRERARRVAFVRPQSGVRGPRTRP